MPRLPLVASLALLAVAGCVHERSKSIGVVPEGALARESAGSERAFAPTAAPSRTRVPPPIRSPEPEPEAAAAVVAPRDGAPAPPAAHRAIPAGESLADRARDTFLSSTTDLAAERVTLYVPRALASEVSLEGTTVADDGPGRRVAAGAAVLRLRRLTVRAASLTVVVRDDNPNLQASARGGVSLRSDQPASVVEESGLRSLILRNDGYTPLR